MYAATINEPLLSSDRTPEVHSEKVLKEKQKFGRTVKLASAFCLGLGLLVTSTFSSFYFSLLSGATTYTAAMAELADVKNAAD